MPAHLVPERLPAHHDGGPWRMLRGPLLAIGLAVVYQSLDPAWLAIFDDDVVFLFAVVFVGFVDGLVAGLATALVGGAAVLLGPDGSVLHHGPLRLPHLLVSALVLPVVALLVGLLRRRYDRLLSLESETRAYQTAVLQNSLDLILVVGDDGVVRDVNRAVFDVLGHRPGTMRGRSIDDFLHPADRDAVRGALDRAARESGYAAEFDARFRHADGQWRFLEARGRGIQGRVASGVVLSTRDVTEHVEAVGALRGSEERFRALVEHSEEVFSIIEADGSTRYRSPSVKHVLGYAPEEMSDDPLELVHPDDKERVRGIIASLVQDRKGTTGPHDLRIRAADGSWRTVEATGTNLLDDPAVSGIVVNWRDVTERRELERARRESEALYRQIVETCEEGVWIVDEGGITTFVNERMAEIFGLSCTDMLGREAFEVIGPEGWNGFEERMERLRRGIRETFLVRSRNAAGGEIWLSFSASPLVDGDDRFVGSLALVTDVSDRRRAEEELRQAHKMEAIGRLAGGIAHDFNNVLTAISGFTELSLGDPDLSEDHRENLGEIREAAERARTLTRQLLAFSRRQVLERERLDPAEIVAGMEGMLERLLGDDVELATRLDGATPTVLADRGQLEQVLLNLAINARDAMPSGGRLTIATRLANGPDGDGDTGALVEVSDTGVGMDEATLERVFEPFFTTKSGAQGTGLGLATVYGIVSQSGGRVEVDSRPRRGTTFRVWLPAAPDEAEREPRATADTRPESAAAAVAARVLLVEDDAAVRGLAGLALRTRGHEVLEAGDGVQALGLVSSDGGRLDLVVTDVRMPGMGGIELVQRLRDERPDLRVIFMSGYSEELFHDAAPLVGAAFLPKPFTPGELTAKVERALTSA